MRTLIDIHDDLMDDLLKEANTTWAFPISPVRL